MKVSAKWVDGYTFIASGETNHYTVMDASYETQPARASTPNELLLQAMAGCTGMDIVSILKKMKQRFTGLEVNIEASRTNDFPKLFETINMEYVVHGSVDRESLQKAIDLSMEKYCNISITLERAGAKVNVASRIVSE
jgi:putative redox protein